MPVVGGYYVYLLECADGTLYTGVATDVERRVAQHNRGAGAKYLRGRTPARVIAQRGPMERGDALRLELEVKRTARPRKQRVLAEEG